MFRTETCVCVLAVGLLNLVPVLATDFKCDANSCFFSAKDCRSQVSGIPASIHSASENIIASQVASASGGTLGLGGYYFTDDGLGWEDSTSTSYTPSGFNPVRSGFLTVDGGGSWNVVSFGDRSSFSFLCKIPTSETTTTRLTTIPLTTSMTTLVATTLPSTTVTAIASTTTTATQPVNTTAPSTTALATNATASNNNITTTPLGTVNTTLPMTSPSNVSSIPTNYTYDAANTTLESEAVSTLPPALISRTITRSLPVLTEAPSTSLPVPTTTTGSPKASNATHPIGIAFKKWSQTLIAFTSPLPLAVPFTAPFSDGASSYTDLVAVMDSSDMGCMSPNRAASPINFANRALGVFTFAAPASMMNVFTDTTYYVCVGDAVTGVTYALDNATITVSAFHSNFGSGFRTIGVGASKLLELALPSISTVPFVIKLEVYDYYSFAIGSCTNVARTVQSPILADTRLFLALPDATTAESLMNVCVSVPQAQLQKDVPPIQLALVATARVKAAMAGHALLITLNGAAFPLTAVGAPVVWTSLTGCSVIPQGAAELSSVASTEYAFAYLVPSSTPQGSGICVSIGTRSESGTSMATAAVQKDGFAVSVVAAATPLIVQQETVDPIALSSYISYGDATNDFDGYIAALGAMATAGTNVWLTAEGRGQCSNASSPRFGETSLVAGSAVQWSTSGDWATIPVGSFDLCYLSGDGSGQWLRVGIVIIDRLTGTMASYQKLLLGSGIYTSLVMTGITTSSLQWTVSVADTPANCSNPNAFIATGTFYQQGNTLFGTLVSASVPAEGSFVLCGAVNAGMRALSFVDVAPQVEGPSEGIVAANYFPATWVAVDIAHACEGSFRPRPLGIVFPLSKVMWSAVSRFVPPTGLTFTSQLSATDGGAGGDIATFFIPCPVCPVIALPSVGYSGCVGSSDLVFANDFQYLSVAATNQPSGSISALPYRSGVSVRLVPVERSLDLSTLNKVMVCMGDEDAAFGYVSAAQTLRFVSSISMEANRQYIACSRSPNSGAWVYAGVVSTLSGNGGGETPVGAASIRQVSGLALTIRIPAASNLSITLEGFFPDVSPGAYSLSFAYPGVSCSVSDSDRLISKIPINVVNQASGVAVLDLSQQVLANGTATVCFHTGSLTVVPVASTAVSPVTFVYPTMRTINYLQSMTIPTGFDQAYTFVVTDSDYTPAQILFTERNADGSLTCNVTSDKVAALLVVDSSTRTTILSPFVPRFNVTRTQTLQACISGRVGSAVRWFPTDFTLSMVPAGSGGVAADAFVLRMWFTNPINALSPAFGTFATNRATNLDGKANATSTYPLLIGQLGTASAVVIPVPVPGAAASVNLRVVEWYASLVVGGGNLAIQSATGDEQLAVLNMIALTYLDGRVVAGYGSVRVGTDAFPTSSPAPEEDTTSYSTRAFLIFICIAAPITIGLGIHALMNKVKGGNAAVSSPTLKRDDVQLHTIVSREEPSQVATEMSPSRVRDDGMQDVSSPIPEHPLRSVLGPSVQS